MNHNPPLLMKKRMTLLVLIPVVLATFWLVGNSRAAPETPEYKVVRTDAKFEIRDYPALTRYHADEW